MLTKKEAKRTLKRLKKKLKDEPKLFARVASLEMRLRNYKQARKRLENGLDDFPDYNTARVLLAECLSSMEEHEESLHHFKLAYEKDPKNQAALSGYIQALQEAGNPVELRRNLFELYRLDPYNDLNARRLQKALGDRIASDTEGFDEWPHDWHLGDFTYAGAFARKVAGKLGLVSERTPLPQGFEPKVDESAVQHVIESQARAGQEGVVSRHYEAILEEPDEKVLEEDERGEGYDELAQLANSLINDDNVGEDFSEEEAQAISALFSDGEDDGSDELFFDESSDIFQPIEEETPPPPTEAPPKEE
ncbi:hypothetical protein GF324_11100, partial [bacterium]|nr:hypothetical protein [bacterium]